MELVIPLLVLLIGLQYLKTQWQRQRIALLGSHLSQHHIEKLMKSLTEGYLRALGEDDVERRSQIWGMLGTAENELSQQFGQFSEGFSKVWGDKALVSTLPVTVPYADKLFPQATFDMRQAIRIHAQGIASAAQNQQNLSQRDKAFLMSAELYLMQHTCHWFCRSKAVATARMLAMHQTTYEQLIASVSAETRQAYCKLIRHPKMA